MRYLLTIISILSCCWSSYAQVDSVDIWISRINNNQLKGTCHYAWTIEVDKDATEVFKLVKAGKSVTSKLINSLTDKNRGVICHFILSTLSDTLTIETLEMDGNKVRYRVNGLEFEERAGIVHATTDDLKRIKIVWDKRNQ